jgi:hypothetical protein
MLSQFHVEASFESSSENHAQIQYAYLRKRNTEADKYLCCFLLEAPKVYPPDGELRVLGDYLPLFDIRILVYFSDIVKQGLLIIQSRCKIFLTIKNPMSTKIELLGLKILCKMSGIFANEEKNVDE